MTLKKMIALGGLAATAMGECIQMQDNKCPKDLEWDNNCCSKPKADNSGGTTTTTMIMDPVDCKDWTESDGCPPIECGFFACQGSKSPDDAQAVTTGVFCTYEGSNDCSSTCLEMANYNSAISGMNYNCLDGVLTVMQGGVVATGFFATMESGGCLDSTNGGDPTAPATSFKLTCDPALVGGCSGTRYGCCDGDDTSMAAEFGKTNCVGGATYANPDDPLGCTVTEDCVQPEDPYCSTECEYGTCMEMCQSGPPDIMDGPPQDNCGPDCIPTQARTLLFATSGGGDKTMCPMGCEPRR